MEGVHIWTQRHTHVPIYALKYTPRLKTTLVSVRGIRHVLLCVIAAPYLHHMKS